MQTRIKNLVPVCSSLLGHGLVVALVLLHFEYSRSVPKQGLNQEQVLPGYTYQEPIVRIPDKAKDRAPVPAAKPIPMRAPVPALATPVHVPAPRQVQKNTTPPAPVAVKKMPVVQPSPTQPRPQMRGNGEPVPALLALLHAAIQQHQQYPPNALEMEREGRITLRFMLYTNGTIDHLRIVKSSGTSSLDTAALAAVNEAVPFKHVERYLQQSQEYQIDVVFELT